ncbi:beta-galactosidase [Metabacillus elymi]|uniref:Beta-galactosidase n=1 Tax=Metabacillus elymi TaxID=2745198 RepID=A0ABX6S8P8_9BACI|nr:beta-galactosidase [Metabacillus sp. KUDC1714]QNF30480.1 beta-galactosidase [Metabacillus sp. KUDC1714]
MSEKLYHGAAYYPELWTEDVIEQDIKLMLETGINVVRIGEFAWSTMEPIEDQINLSFFKVIVNKLYEHGIETIFCTPTPTPPIWFTYKHPERMYVDRDGRTMGHGSRQHACTNNHYFRERAAIITEHIVQTLGNHPGIIGWQIDNEFKCHVSECMCETCKSLWHEWLKNRYKTIENLNEAWGTHIWSEYYHHFEQVPQPGPAPFLHNSSLNTMYKIFSMEKIAEFSDQQAEVIRTYSSAPITHNSSIAFSVDNERLFKNLDFASFDTYASIENFSAYLINCDLWRNFKKGKEFWIMETSTSFAASLESCASPHPNGYLKAEAAAAYALGAEGFCYWLWRQQRTGCEQPHSSVISAWGKPTVGYKNVIEVEHMRKEFEPIILSTKPVQADLAITYSDRAKVFLATEPHKGLNHRGLVTNYYERILSMGIHRDVIPEGASFEGYKVVLTPFIHFLSDDYLIRGKHFVENGGIWIVGPLTGGRTEEHTIHTDRALGELEKLAGVKVLFTYPMDQSGTIGSAFGCSAPLGLWSTVFEYSEEHSVGTITEGLSAGKSFLTEHSLGKGKIVMLGAMPIGREGDVLLKRMIDHYSILAEVNQRTDVTPGTIVAPRENDHSIIWFMINMDGNGGSVTIPFKGYDIKNKIEIESGKLEIGPFECKMVEFQK